jgi:hypothetical protein
MRCFLVVLIASAGIGCAQSSGNGRSEAEPDKTTPQDKNVVLCRLETVTWNPQTEELSWVISMHDVTAGAEQAVVQEKYTIHIDTAVMNAKGEGRRFDPGEARQVGALMDMITAYTVESTVWWSKGLGEKLDGSEGAPTEYKERNKDKDDKPRPKPEPVVRVPVAVQPDSPAQTSRWLTQLSQLPRF